MLLRNFISETKIVSYNENYPILNNKQDNATVANCVSHAACDIQSVVARVMYLCFFLSNLNYTEVTDAYFCGFD